MLTGGIVAQNFPFLSNTLQIYGITFIEFIEFFSDITCGAEQYNNDCALCSVYLSR